MKGADQLSYIMDGNGNYYRINGNDQLVVADDRETAGVFGLFEANQRIGTGKKSRFYSVVPVEIEAWEEQWVQRVQETQETPAAQKIQKAGESTKVRETMESTQSGDFEERAYTKMVLPYDLKGLDWSEYLTHFCYLVSGISRYQDELKLALSELDLQICDLMHYVELYDLEPVECVRSIKLLKECREQRRDVKDEMYRVDCFQKTIGSSTNLAKVKDSLKQIKKLESRAYHPRKLQKLFENCKEKTSRGSKLMRVFEEETCMDAICKESMQEENGVNMISEGNERERDMNVISEDAGMTRRETVFDGKTNDWGQFARQQLEFYENAEQYMRNLEMNLEELDEKMEDILCEMEKENYNAAQGYRVFKELQELRREKSVKQRELECMQILTEGIDCGILAADMQYCVDEIEEVMGKDNAK